MVSVSILEYIVLMQIRFMVQYLRYRITFQFVIFQQLLIGHCRKDQH